jgi:hypothetical protein
MDTRGLRDEINVKLVVPAATDEVLVAAAKLGVTPPLRSCGRATRIQHSRWPIASWETETMQKT